MVHVRSIFRHARMNLQLLLQALPLVAAAIAMTSAIGCGHDDNQQGGVVAVTALSNCAAGASYQGNAWGRTPYGQMKATPYGYGVRGFHPTPQAIRNEGFCGCAAGTQPMCDSQAGVICMPIEVLSGADLALWQPGPQGLNFSGYAGYTAYGNIYDPRAQRRATGRLPHSAYPTAHVRIAQTHQCASHIGQTCTVGTSACDQGSYCRPIPGHRNVGICAR
jgi:hypothetical protein